MKSLLLMLPFLVLASCFRHGRGDGGYAGADSLGALSAEMRYKDVAASLEAAREALRLAGGNRVRTAEALNDEAACCQLMMDYGEAERLYTLAEKASTSEIERLAADVGRMQVCRITAQNKRFYDFRSSASRRMERIGEDLHLIADGRQLARLRRAVTDFYMVTALYCRQLEQREASLEAMAGVPAGLLAADTAQWLIREYLLGSGGMTGAATDEEAAIQEFDHLVNCIVCARAKGYAYQEADASLSLAEKLARDSLRRFLPERRPGVMTILGAESMSEDSLVVTLIRNARALAERQGIMRQISGAHQAMAIYYNYKGMHEEALGELGEALEWVNVHHRRMYGEADTAQLLATYREDDDVYPELGWIADEGVCTVPEWILHLRELLSMTYSALGMKRESDYNRNVYLDLLDYTRQDKQLERRYQTLEDEARQLDAVLALVIAGLVLLVVFILVMSSRWRRRNEAYMAMLRRVLAVCRSVTAAIPPEAHEMEDVAEAMGAVLGRELGSLLRAEDVRVVTDGDDAVDCGGGRRVQLPLIPPGKEQAVGSLVMTVPKALGKDETRMLELILPYLAWTVENGLNLVSLDGRRRMLEKEERLHSMHLAEGKRQNTVKRAYLSIVAGMLPYIDRMANEAGKLSSTALTPEARGAKLAYISELAGKINECNEILTLWIKMKQGALSLNIETFALDELLRIVAKGRRSFELKRQTLEVRESGATVKGDKALTLFMINTLADNARKYTQEGGAVSVFAQETEDYVEVSVRDNGPGLSEEDIRRILEEKVFSPGNIGMDTAADKEALRRQKGSGFGLMNCKGIIDKYRKTGSAFSVCRFSIESELGRGSTFSFRLPRGIARKALSLLLLPVTLAAASCTPEAGAEREAEAAAEMPADTLLAKANEYADMVYYCNVDGYFEDALIYADSVMLCMNDHYVRSSGRSGPLLSIDADAGTPAEQEWLESEFDTDYYILLDVRNEAAVAALALGDFATYTYNNAAYSVLYRLVSRDRSLEAYCRQMQLSSSNKLVGVGIFCLLMAVCLLLWYVLYYRHRVLYRYNVEQLFYINRSVFSVASDNDAHEADIPHRLAESLFREMNEMVSVSALALAVCDEETQRLGCALAGGQEMTEELETELGQALGRRTAFWAGDVGRWSFIPLWAEVGGESRPAGVLGLRLAQANPNRGDLSLLEMAAGYLAAVLYNTVVRVRRKCSDIELAEDEARRTAHEESALHVQNMVLDNCLSTIKHETVYYPNRIKHIVDRIVRDGGIPAEDEARQTEAARELIGYYRDVFVVLSGCAARQLEEVTFRRGAVDALEVAREAAAYVRRMARKLRVELDMTVDVGEGITVTADRVLVSLLLSSLADDALRCKAAGTLRLEAEAEADGHFVRFTLTDPRRTLTREELDMLFSPGLSGMKADDAGGLTGGEYLICKQIIRDHDEFAGRRGCRINAAPAPGGGFMVWFTLPSRT